MPSLDVLTRPIPYRALIVDDEPSICQLLVRLLEQAGWLVVAAAKWADARVLIEDRTVPLDLLLVDQRLPDGNGMDLVPIAQARQQAPDVVVITAYHDEALLIQAIRAGVLDFLHKPFGPSDIAAMLRSRTIRERQRLGIIVDKFDRVDEQFQRVHQDVADIKAVLDRIDPAAFQRPSEQRAAARGGGH